MSVHFSGRWLVTAMLCLGPAGAATAAEPVDEFDTSDGATVITSERLTYDQQKGYALFEKDVVVVDPGLRLKADRLTVRFNESNDAEFIEAEGRVVIEQEDTTAWAGKATYEVSTGKIFLEESPRIKRGRDTLEGDTITFWRDDNKMICEPQARLVLYPEKGGARDSLFGE